MHPLKKWRQDRGLTLDEAGRLVGTSRQTWFGWESGRRRPSGKFMPLIRRATNGAVSADDFFAALKEAA